MSNYWKKRAQSSQEKITTKNIKQTETQLRKYYIRARNDVITQFENTYLHVLNSQQEGRELTPADLYKLDSYWQMQSQISKELEALGDKQISLLSEIFEKQYGDIYNALAIKSEGTFNTINRDISKKLLSEIWCADGKSWSDRVWENTNALRETLNQKLVECVVTGKSSSELKQVLQQKFGVSYSRASTLVRTELAHIQTEASIDRYKDAGVSQVEFLGSAGNCEICAEYDGKIFNINTAPKIPVHPNCTCCYAPVIS